MRTAFDQIFLADRRPGDPDGQGVETGEVVAPWQGHKVRAVDETANGHDDALDVSGGHAGVCCSKGTLVKGSEHGRGDAEDLFAEEGGLATASQAATGAGSTEPVQKVLSLTVREPSV